MLKKIVRDTNIVPFTFIFLFIAAFWASVFWGGYALAEWNQDRIEAGVFDR